MAKSKSSGFSSASRSMGGSSVKGYFDYRNPYTGKPGDASTQKQREYIGDMLKDPFNRAIYTLRLGTLPDVSKMTKKEASYFIDDLKMNRNESTVRLDNKTWAKSNEELTDLARMRSKKNEAEMFGNMESAFNVGKNEVDRYNRLSKKYNLGVTYTHTPRRRARSSVQRTES